MIAFILFGTRGVTTTKASGDFFCPACESRQPYKHQIVRRYFTLYFIPLLPLETLGEYIECQTCKGTYKLNVLNYDPDQAAKRFWQKFQQVTRDVLFLMARTNDRIYLEQIRTICAFSEHALGLSSTPQETQREILAMETSPRAVVDALTEIATDLNDKGKELILRGAFLVALADGDLSEEEMKFITAIGLALQMSQYHVRAVLDEVIEKLNE
ncbi:hypothetical protein ARMA_0145 [Ardenticatena maritima]|uniref:Zinc-ribbon 15 domain-containing protein n=1 Tax=Ardenticatena maritima TaxID=872965 RepID=A0A0M8K6H6_9CHLR|nr:zinc-ribbon domain-containing protein [Ardenticatena maritima]KPL88581.1 hypothetical protein SE16_07395 [Ardenticatena maritima]GAP61722.1 hypothetical protein ARMA_0145 [Ardenticatena maritima]